MSILNKAIGTLKLAGLTLLLFCGTALEGMGLTLYFVGKNKKAEAYDKYVVTEEYQELKEKEDARIEILKEKIKELETAYAEGEILTAEYNSILSGYTLEIEDSEKNFLEKSISKTSNDEVKALLKSSSAMNIAGIASMTLGSAIYVYKVVGTIVSSIENDCFSPVGEGIVDTMSDVIEYDFAPDYEGPMVNEGEVEIKENSEMTFDEDEEILKDIEDEYYRD